MSTPQDNRNQGQDDGNGRSWDAPGTPGGGTTPYGSPSSERPGGPGQYTYPSGAAPGYSYPGGGSFPQQADKGAPPKEVTRAYQLVLAAGILYLLTAVVSTLVLDTSGMPGVGSGVATLGYVIAFVVAAVVTAAYVVLAIFIRKGHNWARITATVLAALNVVSSLIGLLVTPLLDSQAAELGQSAPETSLVAQLISAVVVLLGVAGVVLTYTKPARPYFAPRQIGY
ncbi:hypothetical protein AC792_01420 [Arthrobacter sp. RIT-PI-e]|uniref:hypothetical protein n=1 Tax=Arthrobacter sp. RIT-PI-e TaxID=1681197 RepID=UPI000675F2FB|nr:hypothetical protein [Arthrobacter sp. RIT-PI-e]KNC20307.1 hypothetical protein AC792_01420 [Arthrobacter sp. RIT-PI-e]